MKQGECKKEAAQIAEQSEKKSSRSNGSSRSYERDLDDPAFLPSQEMMDKQSLDQIKEYIDESKADHYLTVKRKTSLCYYVMKLAEYGELYSFIEHTDRFDEPMVRYILDQLLEGMKYLHSNGIVHRDIKPENLLINKKGRIIIADFSFATRLKEMDGDGIFQKNYDPIIDKRSDVGSEIYNAPELWDNEINL